MNEPLRKVAEVEILGTVLDLARNGEYVLVRRELDAYGNERGVLVDLKTFPDEKGGWVAAFKALLNCLGQKIEELAQVRNDLERAHEALRREAEPHAASRPKITARESNPMPSGLLEPQPEGAK